MEIKSAETYYNRAKLFAVITGSLIFQFLFWQEHLGLNLLLYVSLITVLILAFYPSLRSSKSFLSVAAGTIIAAAMVVVNNSATSKFAVMASFVLMLGLANQPQLRLMLNAFFTGILNLFAGPRKFIESLKQARPREGKVNKSWYYLKLALIPLVTLIIFHVMFSIANDRYAYFSGEILTAINIFFARLLPSITFGNIMLTLLGILVSAGSLYLLPRSYFLNRELIKTDKISRAQGQRDSVSSFLVKFFGRKLKVLDLKKEYLSALLLIGLVNALLLIVNVIDVNWLWFGFVPEEGFVLSKFVHEGTYVLIFSILLAMAIVLFYFRGNLNFYKQNNLLKMGAYLWIVQNAVLVVSVGLRNYYYIHHHGLAYKRLGVVIFLLLTLFGLCTVFIKISSRKSLFFLLRTNMLAAYTMMIAITTINWDPLIARVNIHHKPAEKIDYDFLLTLSDKTLAILYQNQEKLEKGRTMIKYPYQPHHSYLHQRIGEFMINYKRRSWKSWNVADAKAYNYLIKNYKPAQPIEMSDVTHPSF